MPNAGYNGGIFFTGHAAPYRIQLLPIPTRQAGQSQEVDQSELFSAGRTVRRFSARIENTPLEGRQVGKIH